jgi:hypothetical protein
MVIFSITRFHSYQCFEPCARRPTAGRQGRPVRQCVGAHQVSSTYPSALGVQDTESSSDEIIDYDSFWYLQEMKVTRYISSSACYISVFLASDRVLIAASIWKGR